jgi:hypothetical protein
VQSSATGRASEYLEVIFFQKEISWEKMEQNVRKFCCSNSPASVICMDSSWRALLGTVFFSRLTSDLLRYDPKREIFLHNFNQLYLPNKGARGSGATAAILCHNIVP